MEDAEAQIDTVARTIWGEARGEGAVGMQAVANVIANRVKNPKWWGHSWLEVCLKKYQFSCWLQSDPNYLKLKTVTRETDSAFAQARVLAAAAIEGSLPDITKGATSYKVTKLPWPHDWGPPKDPLVVIGHHSFYHI